MGFILDLFRPKKPRVTIQNIVQPDQAFTDATTKLVGKPLPVIYGKNVHVFGNVVYRRLSSDKKKTKQAVSFGWGPLAFDLDSIRVNEKRPEFINGLTNARKSVNPGFLAGVKVWVFDGDIGQTPAKDQDWTGREAPDINLVYGLNRTAYIWLQAEANDDVSSINNVEVNVTRGVLFKAGGDYQTPIPSEIATAFPSGIGSVNPIAAALDYILNTDYGPGRDEDQFDDFATWISAINSANGIVDVTRTGFVSWSKITKATADSSGLLISAIGDDMFWDSELFSLTGIPDADGLVVFEAGIFSTFSEQRSSKVCADVEVVDFGSAKVGSPTWEAGATITTYVCTDTITPTTRYEGVFIGLDNVDQSQDTDGRPIIRHAIHLRTDGNYEIWENGSRVRANSGQGGQVDPLTEGADIGYDGPTGFDSEWVWGTYVATDQFSIGYASGSVIYKKAAATVYTSLLSTSGVLKVNIGMWRSNGLAEVVSIPGEEKEARFNVGLEVGKEDSDTHMDVVEDLMTIANAALFQSNGILKAFVAEVKSTSVNLDRSNFMPRGSTTTDIIEVPNVVEIEFREDRDDGEKRTAVFEDSTNFDLYGEIRTSLSMHGIPERMQASRMASYRGRRGIGERLQIAGIADQKFFNLEPGDIVEATMGFEDVTWFTNKKFWIDNIVPENSDGDVDLELIEYGGDSLFDDSHSNTIDQNDPILAEDPTIRLPDPTSTPDRPTNGIATAIVDTSQATRTISIDLSWTIPNQPEYMHDKFLIYRRAKLEDPWVHIGTTSGRASGWRDTSVNPIAESYIYAILSQTALTVLSNFPNEYDIFFEALKFDRPATIDTPVATLLADSRVQISWDYPNPPIDFDAFGIFVRPATTPALPVEPVFGGVSTKETKTSEASTPGDYIITVLARDLYNNLSEAATVNFTMPQPNRPQTFNIENLEDGTFKLSWTLADELAINYLGVAIRYVISGPETWENAAPLHAGTLSGTSHIFEWLPGGPVVILISGFDTALNRNPIMSRIVANIPDPILDNALEEFDFKTGVFLDPDDDWPLGILIDGSIVSTNLRADSLGGDFYQGANPDPMYDINPITPMYDETFKRMIYTTPEIIPSADGRMTIKHTIDATTFLIEYRGEFPITFYLLADTEVFHKDDAEIFFNVNDWVPWPGNVEGIGGEIYQFRITTEPGVPPGLVSEFTVNIDVPDITEEFEDVSISSGGTRLSLTKTYTVIKTVLLTLQDDAGAGVFARVDDKSISLGPLVQVFDNSSVTTTGLVDARIVGY